jgi:hypothetical protein
VPEKAYQKHTKYTSAENSLADEPQILLSYRFRKLDRQNHTLWFSDIQRRDELLLVMRSCGFMPRELERTGHRSEHVHRNPDWAAGHSPRCGRHGTWRTGKLSRIRSSHYHTEHIVSGVGTTCKRSTIVYRSRTFQLACHRARLLLQWTPLAIYRNVLFLCSSQNTCNCYHLRAGIRGPTGPRPRDRSTPSSSIG